jgi:hypothetical protein
MNIIKYKQKVLPEVHVISKNLSLLSDREVDVLLLCHKQGVSVKGCAKIIAKGREDVS